jgi:hypothetical protein
MLKNGNSIYTPYNNENPMLAMIALSPVDNTWNANELHRLNLFNKPILSGEIVINKVGKIIDEIITTNGNILVMDNIAMI